MSKQTNAWSFRLAGLAVLAVAGLAFATARNPSETPATLRPVAWRGVDRPVRTTVSCTPYEADGPVREFTAGTPCVLTTIRPENPGAAADPPLIPP